MRIDLIDGIFIIPGLTSNERLLLLWFMINLGTADDTLSSALDDLASEIGATRPTAVKAVQKLEHLGIVEIRRTDGFCKKNKYKFNYDRFEELIKNADAAPFA
jgi:DNA-binding MarR family transcriptional regulator